MLQNAADQQTLDCCVLWARSPKAEEEEVLHSFFFSACSAFSLTGLRDSPGNLMNIKGY